MDLDFYFDVKFRLRSKKGPSKISKQTEKKHVNEFIFSTKWKLLKQNMANNSSKSDFPSELVAPVKQFQDSLNKLNEILATLESVPLQQLTEKNELDSLSKVILNIWYQSETPTDNCVTLDAYELLFVVFQAKLDCISAFALNSLVWMWLRTNGENPKETGVKTELDRVKASMLRLKEIQDKSKRNPVDAVAAKRLVKGGLWQPKKRPSDSKNENQERKRSKN